MLSADQIHLEDGERLTARSKKMPLALIFQILFNRAFPLIFVIMFPIYHLATSSSFSSCFTFKLSDMSALAWVWLILIMPLGISISAYLVWSYINIRVLLTDKRIIFIEGNKRRQIPYHCVQKVETKNGFVDSELKITLGEKDVLSIDYLSNGARLAEIIKSQIS